MSGISGGGDRSELRPLKPDGSVDHDLPDAHVVGNHKGQFSGFNIVNPRPGTVHQFGTRKDILAARQRGWWVAVPERDGTPAHDMVQQYMSDPNTPVVGGDTLYPEYIHLVTSEENYRRLVEEQMKASQDQLAPAGLGFLDNVPADEFQSGGGNLATRFATKDHGTYVVEGDRVLEHLTPQGILREEDI